MHKIAGLFLSVFLLTVTLTWDASEFANGYKAYCGGASGSYGTPVDTGATLEHPISTPGTYYCAVTAYNENGESGYSNEVFFTIRPIPGAPGNLRLKVLY